MPANYTATILGNTVGLSNKSVLSAMSASTAGPTSLDVLTCIHLLPTTPDTVLYTLRSVSAISNYAATLVMVSKNASQVVFQLFDVVNAVNAQHDVIFTVENSLVR